MKTLFLSLILGGASPAFAAHSGPARLYPDATKTPGAVYGNSTVKRVCEPGYSKTVRNVPAKTRVQVFNAYGIPYADHAQYELDHFVSLELGGNNAVQNLWPEALSDARQKDKVENWLHRQVCKGAITLNEAQTMIEDDWYRVYKEHHLDKARTGTHHVRRK